MLRAIDCPAGLLVTMAGECFVRCPEHGGEDRCTVEVAYRTRDRSVEAASLRDYLASFADTACYAEDLAETIRLSLELAIDRPVSVTVRHSTEGVRLTVVAGAV